MARSTSPDGRFEVHVTRTDDDSYMYGESDYAFFVASVETGDELASFFGHVYNTADGRSTDGVERVAFEGDGVIATHYDGQIERLELPARIAIVEGGAAIELAYRDGRIERRERGAVLASGKYGNVRELTKLVDPPK